MSSKTTSSPYHRQTSYPHPFLSYARRCDWCEQAITRTDFYRLAKHYRLGKGLHATEFKLCSEQCLIDLVLNTNRTTVPLALKDSEVILDTKLIPDAPPL
jgi:hypothetical protein